MKTPRKPAAKSPAAAPRRNYGAASAALWGTDLAGLFLVTGPINVDACIGLIRERHAQTRDPGFARALRALCA